MQPEDSHDAHEWRHKVYSYGPTEYEAPDGASASGQYKLSELRSAVSEQTAQGTIVLRLSRNLFEASTGAHEWGAGYRLAELLLSRPHLVQGCELGPALERDIHPMLCDCAGPTEESRLCGTSIGGSNRAGRSVLELGCGAGLLGVVLARLGARALLTDGSAPTLVNCLHNLRLNGVVAENIAAPAEAAAGVADIEAVCRGHAAP